MPQYGKIRLDIILWFQISLLVLIPLYTYYMSVIKEKVEKAFPHTTVTDTACHYPQDIVFRFGMLTAASFLALLFYVIFKWFNYIQDRIQYPRTVFPKYIYLLAEFIIFPYAITIGTIDGNGTGDLHTTCAVIFFIGLFALIVYLTFTLRNMRNFDASIVTRESWFFKRLACYWNILVVIWCLIQILLDSSKGNDMIVIIEWNLVIINLLWVLSFRTEWKNVYLTLEGIKSGDE